MLKNIRQRAAVGLLFVGAQLLSIGASHAAIALVQHTGKDAGTTTTSTLAFPSANTAGNFVAVVIRGGNTGQVFTVSDSRNNVYRKAFQFNESLDPTSVALYYAENVAGGSNTVTVSDTLAGGTLRFSIFEYSGVATTGSLDGTPLNAEGRAIAIASPSITTTTAGDLILGVIATSDGATVTAGGAFTVQDVVPAAPNSKLAVQDLKQAAAGAVSATATILSSQPWSAAVAAFRPVPTGPPPPADLTIAKSHAGSFIQGQSGATYTLTAANIAAGPTAGSVIVSDTMPVGLAATAFAGTGWSCTLSPLSCNRSDVLAALSSYPPITLTVSVSPTAPASVTNSASISGGGETNTANDGVNDVTTIVPPGVPDLTIAKSHAGSFTQGQAGATYTLTAANGGTGPTVGTVTVTDTLPAGLTATGFAGSGWSCTVSPLTCNRSDVLAAGSAYPSITLTVTVSPAAPASVTNSASIAGGGETNTGNDSVNDLTTIVPPGGAPITLVQHTGKDVNPTTSSTLAFASANTAGNFIAVAIRAGKTGQVFTVTDSNNNVYRKALQASETLDQVTMGLFYAEGIAGGANTVTVSDTVSGGTLRFAIFEYSGVATASSLDGTPGMLEGTSTSLVSPAVTTTSGGDLILGVFSTSDGATVTAGSGYTIQERVPASTSKLIVEDQKQTNAGPITATATIAAAQAWSAAIAAFKPAVAGPPPVADLTIAKSHVGSFIQGQTGRTYTLTATNSGAGATIGTITVTDALPASLTATGFAGPGWSCTLAPLSCNRTDVLAAGGSYPAITLTVSVSPTAPASVTNSATIAGGGETNTGNDGVNDVTAITAAGAPDLTLAKSHSGSFTQGQTGATYTLTATNSGTGPTAGTVTVTDALPSGLTATGFAGTGWSCTVSPLSCNRSDVLAAGSSYPAIALTVNVSGSAPASVTNSASVSGGGETNTANDAATDPTTIAPSGAALVGQWSAVNNWPIVAVHAQLLPTGNVLAWTDYTDNAGAQIWRPATNTFTPKTYSPVSLFCAGHSYLADGRLLVAGGIVGLTDDVGPRESTIFDPATETWSAGPLMTQGRYYPTTTTLSDGRVLVQGGTTTCSTCIADRPEIYDPATNVWTQMAVSATKAFKYYPHTYLLPDGRVLAAAQDDKAVITQVLDLNTQTWTTIDSRLIDGHSSVMYLPGKILKAGTATADNPGLPAAATAYTLDMTQPSPSWQPTATTMAFPRSYLTLTVLPDGQVVATGGSTTTDKANVAAAVYEAEMWSPATQAWTTMSRAQIPREYHSTALLLPDATVLVAGGGRENGRSQPDPKDQPNAEIFSPPYLFKGARPVITTAPAVLQYGTAFTVTTPDAARITKVSLIALSAVTHAFNENQRFVPLTFTPGSGSLTVNPPADGNLAPPGPYMLFLVDTNGVPSIAAMVRLPAPSADSQPPTAPGTLQANVSGSTVNLSWIAATDNVGVTAYNVHRSTTSGFTPSAANKIGQTALLAYADLSLPPATYFYRVTAQDARGNVGNPSNQATANVVAAGVPDLTIAKSHVGSFAQGQAGATYTLTATNGGTGPTVGAVTVTDALPAGLTATGFAGPGWSCTVSPLICNRSDVLAAAASYPAITLTVTVSPTAPASVTNSASIAGGGETNTANDGVNDVTTITPPSATIALVQHTSKDAGSTTSSTLAFASANTAGNFIAVAIRAGNPGQVFTVSDTRNNVYRKAFQASETLDPVTLGLYYAETIAGGANTVTVSVNLSGGSMRFAIFEYSGVAASSSLDGTPGMAEGTSASLASPAVTTSLSGDLILGVLSTAEAATLTAGGGYAVQERVPAVGSKLAVEDQKAAGAGSITATATLSAGQAWAAGIAAFKPAVAGPPPPKLIITAPTEGGTTFGNAFGVTYTTTGDLSQVNHTHWQLDANPVVMDLSFDGVFSFSGVHVGAHTLNAWLVRADHSAITGSDATPVHFTVAVDPSDPTLPTVSITAPAGGATVSGVVTVTANASDNTGVYGVQFKLDGAVLGAEDLVSPYATDWDTATATNGSHVLTAVARDAAGNERTSASVNVTVLNAGPNDPSVIGQWAGPFSWPLVSIHSMLMPNGKVLLYDDHTTSAGVQVWDPVSDTLTSRPYNADNLFCSGHTMLSDGRVLVIGGHLGAYVGIPDTTIFDPVPETWSAASPMSQARWYPTATSLPDGRVLATSGASVCSTCNDPTGSHVGIALIPEVYDPRANTWTQLNNAPLSLPLYPHMHVLPDGRVLAVASQEDPIVSQVLNLSTQTWTVMDPVARDGGSSVQYRPGKILKTGMGRNPDYAAVPSSATAYIMDTTLPSPTWRSIAPMTFPRTQHNLTVLPDGNVLAVGGSTNSNVYDSAGTVKTAEMFDATAETWRTLATMQEPRHYHSTSLLLPDGRVLVAGGGRFGPDFPSAELYSPPYLFKGARPSVTSVPGTIQYNTHVSVSTPDGARIAKVSLIRLGSVTHAFDENQRYVELVFAPIAGGLDVTVPAGQNIILPGHYMLFLVDTNGVPSVGKIVRFPAPWEDTIPPSAPGTLQATTSPGRVDLTWGAASDNTGVALYNVHRGTLPGVTPTTANRVGQTAATSFTDTGFPSGAYYYVVTAQDAGATVGPPSNEVGLVAQADVTFPNVNLTAPSSGATVTGNTTLSANASDDVGVVGVQFLLDGAALGAEDITAPYAYAWNSGLTANGAHTLSAQARDARGNVTTATNVGVTVSNVAIPGLVAAYSLDDASGLAVHDSSFNVNDGTTHSTAWTTGHTSGGLSFTPNAYVEMPNTPSLDISGKGLTIEMWANITASSPVDYVLLSKPWANSSQAYPYYQYGIEYDANGAHTLDFYFGNTANQSVGPVSMTPPTGTWTHIAYTYNGSVITGYVDGVQKVQVNATTDIQARGVPLRLGVDGSFNQGFNGKLDDVRIYNRALSLSEIQQDMTHPVVLP